MRYGTIGIGLFLGVLFGLAAGIGGYTFVYARGASYFTHDAKACANCHVMQPYYDGWLNGPHRSVAVCNDCHTPPGLVGKYATKALNGFWHSFYFTTGTFDEPIRILPRDREITEQNCLRCHEDIVQAMGAPAHAGERDLSCIRCHSSVGHMELGAVSNPPVE